jgi:hypothetical protein
MKNLTRFFSEAKDCLLTHERDIARSAEEQKKRIESQK